MTRQRDTAGDHEASDRAAPSLEWVRDGLARPPRVTVFDPRPARLDEAWIALDDGSLVALRAMR